MLPGPGVFFTILVAFVGAQAGRWFLWRSDIVDGSCGINVARSTSSGPVVAAVDFVEPLTITVDSIDLPQTTVYFIGHPQERRLHRAPTRTVNFIGALQNLDEVGGSYGGDEVDGFRRGGGGMKK